MDNAHRTLHGALLDAQLLAEVYLAMTRGQETLTIDIASPAPIATLAAGLGGNPLRLALAVIAPTEEEIAAHREYLEALQKDSKGHCIWLALEAEPRPQPATSDAIAASTEAVAA